MDQLIAEGLLRVDPASLAAGALHGRGAFPSEWLDGLLGRTAAADDDGRVFELIAQAREQWG